MEDRCPRRPWKLRAMATSDPKASILGLTEPVFQVPSLLGVDDRSHLFVALWRTPNPALARCLVMMAIQERGHVRQRTQVIMPCGRTFDCRLSCPCRTEMGPE